MDIEEAIAVVDLILGSNSLNDLEISVFRHAWTGKKYPDIAEALGYDANYIKDLGAKIWKQLSKALGEKVTKSNIQSVLRRHGSTMDLTPSSHRSTGPLANVESPVPPGRPLQDWGEQVETSNFVGRGQAILTLSSWINDQACRVIALVGMAGLGKTILAAYLAKQNAEDFDVVIWRSLKNILPLEQQLDDLLKSLHISLPVGASLDSKKYLLLEQLKARRCLILFDSADAILAPGNTVGAETPDCEDYRDLFQQLGDTQHQSCIVVTCRTQPPIWRLLIGENSPIRTFNLGPFSPDETQKLLQCRGAFQGQSQVLANPDRAVCGEPTGFKNCVHQHSEFFSRQCLRIFGSRTSGV